MADEKKQNDAQETKPEEKKLSRAEKKALKKKEKESQYSLGGNNMSWNSVYMGY